MRYFEYFPVIEYSDVMMTNILVRAKIRDAVLKMGSIYYNYTVKDSDRADLISTKYYGNSSYTWAIYYANNIVDPINDWPLTTEQFYLYITKKYGSVSEAQNENGTPHHYLLDDEFIIDQTTYEDTDIEANRKKKVTNYEHEFNLNEAKRNIKILDVLYLRQISNEFKVIFK